MKSSFESLFPGRTALSKAFHDDKNPYGNSNRFLTPGRLNLQEEGYWAKSNKVFSQSKKVDDNRHVSVEGSTMVGNHLDGLTDRLNAKVTKFKKD